MSYADGRQVVRDASTLAALFQNASRSIRFLDIRFQRASTARAFHYRHLALEP
jgi:hypothetical protein